MASVETSFWTKKPKPKQPLWTLLMIFSGKRPLLPQWKQESSTCPGKAAAIAPTAPSDWKQPLRPADLQHGLWQMNSTHYFFFKILQWGRDECYNQEGVEEIIRISKSNWVIQALPCTCYPLSPHRLPSRPAASCNHLFTLLPKVGPKRPHLTGALEQITDVDITCAAAHTG